MGTTEQYTIVLDERGRIVLPAPLRRRLDLRPGARLIATVDADNTIHVVLAREQARQLFGLYRHLAPDRSLVDDLLAERRSEAGREDEQ